MNLIHLWPVYSATTKKPLQHAEDSHAFLQWRRLLMTPQSIPLYGNMYWTLASFWILQLLLLQKIQAQVLHLRVDLYAYEADKLLSPSLTHPSLSSSMGKTEPCKPRFFLARRKLFNYVCKLSVWSHCVYKYILNFSHILSFECIGGFKK